MQTNRTDLIQEKETREIKTTSSKLKRGSVKTAALGIDGCGGVRTVKTAAAGIVEWRQLESVVVDVLSGGG